MNARGIYWLILDNFSKMMKKFVKINKSAFDAPTMKNPINHTTYKNTDVIFVHPKHRAYVIWHGGIFYQLTRMRLSKQAWDRRMVYDGLLDEIFVAKQSCGQDEFDELVLGQIGLEVVKLPDKLHGISANKFLAWWEVNRYGFWHAKSVNNEYVQHEHGSLPKQDLQEKSQQAVQASTNNHDMTDMDITSHITQEQGISNNTGKNAKQSKTQMPQKPYKSQEQEQLSGDDIFDALLDELMR